MTLRQSVSLKTLCSFLAAIVTVDMEREFGGCIKLLVGVDLPNRLLEDCNDHLKCHSG